ncbi:MAG TPA: RagB/SusD family nutrient uptake outer membrane protein, partial [Pedobacter sp.]|nr:RagB/SusD family nutrient uptake outer membrane protein [Pedobacter sp.]
ERRVELFTEWGHRWFDLKRWNLAKTLLLPLKPEFNDNDVLYPIPGAEMDRNSNLTPQNLGY